MPASSATMEKRSVPPPPKRLPAARSAKPARELVAGMSEIKLERLLQISFKPRDVELSTAARSKLDGLAEHVATVGGEIQIKAYAGLIDNNAFLSRKTSLERGLAVRTYLVEKGLRSGQVHIRALGVARDGDDDDRVDVFRYVK